MVLVRHAHLENSPAPPGEESGSTVPSACPSPPGSPEGGGRGDQLGRQAGRLRAAREPGPRRPQSRPGRRGQGCLEVKVRSGLLPRLPKTGGFLVNNSVTYGPFPA